MYVTSCIYIECGKLLRDFQLYMSYRLRDRAVNDFEWSRLGNQRDFIRLTNRFT